MSEQAEVRVEPVGFYCDHSDEPSGARTHEGWEWTDDGATWQRRPDVISAHHGIDGEQRCPRAVPVYATAVPALMDEVERLRERLRLAEDVCVMTGWSSHRTESEREKAAYMLWCRWHDHVGHAFTTPKNHPHLNNEVVADLARQRDEIRNQALAKLREEEV